MNLSSEKFNIILQGFIDNFARTGKAESVNFRSLVPAIKKPERYTHLIHPYPAKLLVHIPFFFLQNTILSQKGDKVLDPFAGSGTVLLEAIIAGRHPIGAECNPIAQLISRVKTKYIATKKIEDATIELCTRKDVPVFNDKKLPSSLNFQYWYSQSTFSQLKELFSRISLIEDLDVSDFLWLCFSCCVKKVSFADPKFSVPVRLKKESYVSNPKLHNKIINLLNELENINVIEVFKQIVQKNIERLKTIDGIIHFPLEMYSDSRKLETSHGKLKSNSVSLVITSPPYAGAQKYIRAQSLSLGWLGYCAGNSLVSLKDQSIGREDYKISDYKELIETGVKKADLLLKKIWDVNNQRAHIAASYLCEMRQAIKESIRVLKPRGYMVLVVGNNNVCGYDFLTSEYLREIAEQEGLTTRFCLIDTIQSFGLMTARNKTASIITCEWIFLFEKA